MSPHFLTSISLVMRNTDDKDHEAILLKSTKTAANPNLRNSPDTKANPNVTYILLDVLLCSIAEYF